METYIHVNIKGYVAMNKGPGVDFEKVVGRIRLLAENRLQLDEEDKPEVHDVLHREEEAAREVGYVSRLLVQATLPHSQPAPGVLEFERTNGFVSLKITADSAHGLPYGTYPRLLLAWITSEAVRRKSPKLELGDSMRGFMSELGLEYGSGPRGSGPRLREHMQRLFTATVSATVRRDGEWRYFGFCPVEAVTMFWNPKSLERTTTWPSAICLNQTFYDEITNQPVPVDMYALKGLGMGRRASPMALDIYQWLTHRFSYLKTPLTVPWEALQLQFGGDYTRLRKFREKFIHQLGSVMNYYPQANVEVTTKGLLLRPSKTHVPMRLVSNRKR